MANPQKPTRLQPERADSDEQREQQNSGADPDSGPSRTSRDREPSALQQSNDDESAEAERKR